MEKRKMSIKEAKRLSVMEQIDKKVLTVRQASQELALSLRHTKRILKRYRLKGPSGLISKHMGKVSPNRIDPKVKGDVLKVLHLFSLCLVISTPELIVPCTSSSSFNNTRLCHQINFLSPFFG